MLRVALICDICGAEVSASVDDRSMTIWEVNQKLLDTAGWSRALGRDLCARCTSELDDHLTSESNRYELGAGT